MCKLHNEILRIRGEEDLNNEDIAQRMGPILKKPISGSAVGKYFTNGSGVPLENIEAFLAAFGMKAVSNETVCIPKSKYDAMLEFAADGFQALREESK